MTGGAWDFSWEAIAVLVSVLAVIVASVLGRQGSRLASRAVERSKQDYVALRADLAAEAGAELKLRARAFDDQLNPFWSWRSDPHPEREPDWMPVQRALNELEVHSERLLDSVRALVVSTSGLGSSDTENDLKRELCAFYGAHYVSFLFFTNAKTFTRDSLRHLYECELLGYGDGVQESVLSALDEVGRQVAVTKAVTSVNRIMINKWKLLLDELLLRAYRHASADRT